MSTAEIPGHATTDPSVVHVDLALETAVIPVTDVDRAKQFYASLGWRLDADLGGDGFRIVQFTPAGFRMLDPVRRRAHVGRARVGRQSLLVVSDIEAARDDLAVARRRRRARSSTTAPAATTASTPTSGRTVPTRSDARTRRSPSSATPTATSGSSRRSPAGCPVGSTLTAATFDSVDDLARALERAEAAHGEHEKRTGERDEDWPAWYAAYMLAEQTGDEPPA